MDIHILDIVSMGGIYAILAMGLNVVVGWAGIASVAQAAFCGIGAMSTAVATTKFGWNPVAGIAAGVVIASLLSLFVSVPAMRLRDDYVLLTTLGFGEVVCAVFRNWDSLTGGLLGISAIPPLRVWSFSFRDSDSLPWLIWLVAACIAGLLYAIERSPFGRAMTAVRDNDVAAASVGVSPISYKLAAIALSAAIGAVAGSLLAHKLSYISSETGFDTPYSVIVLAMVIIGGRGSITGAVAGAVLLTSFPELLRRVGMGETYAGPVRQILYGVLLIVTVICRPRGLLGKLDFREKAG